MGHTTEKLPTKSSVCANRGNVAVSTRRSSPSAVRKVTMPYAGSCFSIVVPSGRSWTPTSTPSSSRGWVRESHSSAVEPAPSMNGRPVSRSAASL